MRNDFDRPIICRDRKGVVKLKKHPLAAAAMLQSRTSKVLAGLLQQQPGPPLYLLAHHGVRQQQPGSTLYLGSHHLSTSAAFCINKHPDVIRGKVKG